MMEATQKEVQGGNWRVTDPSQQWDHFPQDLVRTIAYFRCHPNHNQRGMSIYGTSEIKFISCLSEAL